MVASQASSAAIVVSEHAREQPAGILAGPRGIIGTLAFVPEPRGWDRAFAGGLGDQQLGLLGGQRTVVQLPRPTI
jgi:hypothetical protein